MEFVKQTSEPLFPKLLWNRPVNRSGAGRMLLVGGHRDEFNDLQAIFQLANASGIGTCHAILPDSLRKLLGEVPDTTFVPSSPSGSLGKLATAEILHIAENYDGLVIGANLSNNSETAVLVDSLVQKHRGRLVVFGDTLPAFKHQIESLTNRENTFIIGGMTDLFGVANAMSLPLQIKDGGALNKLEIVKQIHEEGSAQYLLLGRDMIVAAENQLSLTTAVSSMEFFNNAAISVAASFWIQNPSKPFEALTTAAYILQQARAKLVDKSDEVLTIQEIEKAIAEVLRNDSW